MFTYEQIQSLNDLEFEVYNYIVKNSDKILEMTIRELAQETHVSTTVILRFCKKVGCNGYSEFKVKLKLAQLNDVERISETELKPVLDYLQKMNKEEKSRQLYEAASLICQAQKVIFIGAGSSGIMAKYGARCFNSMGKLTYCIDDPFYPIPDEIYEGAVIVALYVSGEIRQLINRVNKFKNSNATIITITNSQDNTIAKMADLSLFYHVPVENFDSFQFEIIDVTTQIPVVYLIEELGRQVYKLIHE